MREARGSAVWQAGGLDGAYDIVVEGATAGSGDRDAVRRWAEAGATWWLEANWEVAPRDVVEVSGARLRQGPPHVE